MARLRVATAGNRWKAAKEHARLAKRRRKEVKLIARRARKQAKQAKADLVAARKALAEAEAKFAQSGIRVAARKPIKAKSRPVSKPTAAVPRKKAAPARQARSRRAGPSPAPGSAVQVLPASLQESDSFLRPAQAGSAIRKLVGGNPEPAVIAWAAVVTAAPTKSIHETQPGAMR